MMQPASTRNIQQHMACDQSWQIHKMTHPIIVSRRPEDPGCTAKPKCKDLMTTNIHCIRPSIYCHYYHTMRYIYVRTSLWRFSIRYDELETWNKSFAYLRRISPPSLTFHTIFARPTNHCPFMTFHNPKHLYFVFLRSTPPVSAVTQYVTEVRKAANNFLFTQ